MGTKTERHERENQIGPRRRSLERGNQAGPPRTHVRTGPPAPTHLPGPMVNLNSSPPIYRVPGVQPPLAFRVPPPPGFRTPPAPAYMNFYIFLPGPITTL